MTALLTALLAQFWPYIIAGIAALAGLWGVRRSGVKAERAKQAEREKEARDVADAVDNDIGAMTPEQRKEALRKWSKS